MTIRPLSLSVLVLITICITTGCAEVTLDAHPDDSTTPEMETPSEGLGNSPQLLPDGQGSHNPNGNPTKQPNPSKEQVPTGPGCAGMSITEPKSQSLAEDGVFTVKGTVLSAGQLNITEVKVEGKSVPIKGDEFSTTIQLPDGSHTIAVQCGDHWRQVHVTAGLDRPWITLEQPPVGAMISGSNQPVQVVGRIDSQFGVDSFTINDQPVQVSPGGRFEHSVQPESGMNHIILAARSRGGAETDLVRSFVYGKFRPFKGGDGPGMHIRVSPSGLDVVSDAIQKNLKNGGLEEAVEPHMGRHGDIQLHEIKFDDIDVDTVPVHGGLRVRVSIQDFRLKFTYHYRIAFIGGRIRGWAKARPLALEAQVNIQPDGNGGFSADLSNVRAELNRFDLDLNDFYSIVEGLVQPMVKDMGKKAINDALKSVVIGQILQRELFSQPIDILGKQTEVNIGVDRMDISPSGIAIQGRANLKALDAVHDAPGIISLGREAHPERGPGEVELAVSADLFNNIFTEAWRAGLLDQDLTPILVEGGTTLSTAILSGVAGDGLLETFGIADIGVRIKAVLPPVARTSTQESGRIDVQLGGLQLELSSQDEQGQSRVWAVLTLRGNITALPVWDGGRIKMELAAETKLDLSSSPIFPIEEEGFEDFLSTLVDALPASLLAQLADSSFSFDSLDTLGLRVGHVDVSTPHSTPSFLRFGVDLSVR